MKLYRFFLSILAGAALAAGCVQEQVISSLDSFQVENSYLSIALEGGIANTAVKATAQWSFDDTTVPEWLTVTPRSGGSEVTGIVFAADANTGSSARTAERRPSSPRTSPTPPSSLPPLCSFSVAAIWSRPCAPSTGRF